MTNAAFLDRDGVINRKAAGAQYVTRWEQMKFLSGATEAIRLLNRAGFLVVVVSNQRCVARGFITAGQLESMHARMCQEFAAAGASIDAVYFCPHEKQPPCFCRKPRPGMLLAAAQTHDIDLGSSWMIGDSDCDVEAGHTAGCNTVRISDVWNYKAAGADLVAGSLLEATHKILHMKTAAREVPKRRFEADLVGVASLGPVSLGSVSREAVAQGIAFPRAAAL